MKRDRPMGNNKGWIKDTVIQLFFIVLVVVLTV